jgi:hypothetical protein
LSEEDWVDAVREAIRQADVFIRVESIQIDHLADKGENKYLLVYLRLANSGHERTIAVAGFSRETHQPVLTDGSGRHYAFLEERLRKRRGRGPIVFDVVGPQAREMPATGFLDQLLVFAAPQGKAEALNLELPASAWGRTGVCKFRCQRFFKADIGLKKGQP